VKTEFASVFVDGMTAKGWKVGKETCKDWQAAFRTWLKKDWNKQYKNTIEQSQKRILTKDTQLW
jgi:seryl-tRNA(Sec) selenium transferase